MSLFPHWEPRAVSLAADGARLAASRVYGGRLLCDDVAARLHTGAVRGPVACHGWFRRRQRRQCGGAGLRRACRAGCIGCRNGLRGAFLRDCCGGGGSRRRCTSRICGGGRRFARRCCRCCRGCVARGGVAGSRGGRGAGRVGRHAVRKGGAWRRRGETARRQRRAGRRAGRRRFRPSGCGRWRLPLVCDVDFGLFVRGRVTHRTVDAALIRALTSDWIDQRLPREGRVAYRQQGHQGIGFVSHRSRSRSDVEPFDGNYALRRILVASISPKTAARCRKGCSRQTTTAAHKVSALYNAGKRHHAGQSGHVIVSRHVSGRGATGILRANEASRTAIVRAAWRNLACVRRYGRP